MVIRQVISVQLADRMQSSEIFETMGATGGEVEREEQQKAEERTVHQKYRFHVEVTSQCGPRWGESRRLCLWIRA